MEIDVLAILERIKQDGHYAVGMFYGENVGCDDSDVKQEDRRIQIVAYPVGVLAGAVKSWVGTVKDLSAIGSSKSCEVLPNPPGKLPEKTGWYVWGTEDMVKTLKESGRA